MKYLSIPLLIAVIQLTACGGGGSSSGGTTNPDDTGVPPASSTNPEDQNSPNTDPQPTDDADGSNGGPTPPGGGTSGGGTNSSALDLEGSWMSGCFQTDNTTYSIRILQFQGNQVTMIQALWEGRECEGDSDKGGQLKGTFSVGQQVTTSTGTKAYEVDFDFVDNGETYKWFQLADIKDGNLYLGWVGLDGPRPTEVEYGLTYSKGSSDGSTDDGTGTPGNDTGTPGGDSGTPSDNTGGMASDLNGTWASSCFVQEIQGQTYGLTESYQFNGSNLAYIITGWLDTTCAGTPEFTNSFNGNVVVGNQVTTSSGTPAYEIDIQIDFAGDIFKGYGLVEVHTDRIYFSEMLDSGRGTNIDYEYPYTKQ